MESKLPHTNDEQEILTSQHTGHHDDHNEDEHHGEEKKSVFKRFKDKARKLKNTVTKHGQDQDPHDDDEEDDETVEDPDVHGAPMYDSALGGPDPIVAQPKDNLERPSAIAEDRYTKPVASHGSPLTVPAGAYGTNSSGKSGLLGRQEANPEKRESKFEDPTGMEKEVPFTPRVPTPVTENTYGTEDAFDSFENHGQDETHEGLKSSTGKSTGMMEVPHAPLGLGSGTDPAKDETKVTHDPTQTEGGNETELSQAVKNSFDKMGIQDPASERKRFDPEHPDNLPRNTLAGNQSTQSSSYTEMMSSVASNIASKFGYGDHPTKTESNEKVKNSGSTATDYAHSITDKVTETLAPVYDKVVDVGSSVMSKVQGTVSGTGHQQMHGTEIVKGTDKGVSVKEADEDKADAIGHRGNQDKSGEDRPMGRVTESAEVRSRLGRTDGNEGQLVEQ